MRVVAELEAQSIDAQAMLFVRADALSAGSDMPQSFQEQSRDGNLRILLHGIDGAGDVSGGTLRLSAKQLCRFGDFDAWIAPRLAKPLKDALRRGAYLLLVVLADADREQAICMALMDYSTGQFQVHDLNIAAGGSVS